MDSLVSGSINIITGKYLSDDDGERRENPKNERFANNRIHFVMRASLLNL